MSKKDSEQKPSEQEELLRFNDERSWIKKSANSKVHVVAEITGIHMLNKQASGDDSYSPFENTDYQLPRDPQHENRARTPQPKQFGNEIERGFTEFNKVAKKLYSHAGRQVVRKPVTRKRKKTSLLETILRVLVVVTLGLIVALSYLKINRWLQASSVAKRLKNNEVRVDFERPPSKAPKR